MHNENLSNYCLLLRVIASHVVVIGHAAGFFKVFRFTQWPTMPYLQSVSVIVFFFLSGFTISWICDQRKASSEYSFEKFAFDRFCRLTIPLFPVLLFAAVAEWAAYRTTSHPFPESFNLTTFLTTLFLVQDFPFFGSSPFGTNRALWTIAQEWWLYLTYGFLVLRVSSTSLVLRMLLTIVFVLSLHHLFPLLLKLSLFGPGPTYWAISPEWWVYLACVIFAIRVSNKELAQWILLGAILIYLILRPIGARGHGLAPVWIMGAIAWPLIRDRRLSILSSRCLALTLIAVALLLCDRSVWPPDGSYSLLWNVLAAAPIFIIAELVVRNPRGVFSFSTKVRNRLDYMGRYSYTLYLCHYPLMDYVKRQNFVEEGSIFGFVAVLAMVVVLAITLAKLFEFKYKEYRDKAWALISGHAPKTSITSPDRIPM